VHTDRGDVTAPLIVDALGWRRVLGPGENVQPPEAALSRGLEVHPAGAGSDLELWIDPRYVDAGYGWSFPARDEVRIGVGSFDPHDPVKQPTLRLVEDVSASPDGYQGNWIPHRLRPAVEDGVFFAGDSAGHCLPLTAEGIRTAFYFGIALGRELRAVVEGRSDRESALSKYGAFSASHRVQFECMYLAQQSIRYLHGRPLDSVARFFTRARVSEWAFRHYLEIAPPSFAVPAPAVAVSAERRVAA
jgi:flavin-dependent dehydrogenase